MQPSPPPLQRSQLVAGRSFYNSRPQKQPPEVGARLLQLQFQERLRQYKTFTPQLSLPRASSPPPAGSTAASGTNASGGHQPSLDQMLAYADNAAATVQKSPMAGDDPVAAVSTNVGHINAVPREDAFAASHRVAPDPLMEDAAFLIWLRENENASQEAIRAEMMRRNRERLESERTSRLKHLQEWQSELNALMHDEEVDRMNNEQEQATEEFMRNQQDTKTPLRPHPPPRRGEEENEAVDRQRLAWEIFAGGDGSPHELREQFPLQRVLETDVDPMMVNWVQGNWVDHTHRHERAALKIQSCFRVFCAKRVANSLRLLRSRTIKLIMKQEEEAMLAWEVALTTQRTQNETSESVDKTFRAVKLFSNHIGAAVTYRRRAMRRAQEARDEVEIYAATRVQCIWRGYQARRLLEVMKDPQIAVDRVVNQQVQATIVIQSWVRRHLVNVMVDAKVKVTLMMQRLFRRYIARQHLAALRRRGRYAEDQALYDYAAGRIQNSYKMYRMRRDAVRDAHLQERRHLFATLQTWARGFVARREVWRIKMRKIHRSATKIQGMYRCFVARAVVRQRKADLHAAIEKATRLRAACILQRTLRRFKAMSEYRRLKRRDKASRDIARVWAGHKGRKSVRELKKRLAEEAAEAKRNDAATLIQAHYRGYRIRQEKKLQEDAAAVIQNSMRQALAQVVIHGAVEEAEEAAQEVYQNDCADTIGRFYVSHIRWPALIRYIHGSARSITQFFRSIAARRALQRIRQERFEAERQRARDAAVVIIQHAYKRHCASKVVAVMRQHRLEEYNILQRDEAVRVLQRFFAMLKQRTQARVVVQAEREKLAVRIGERLRATAEKEADGRKEINAEEETARKEVEVKQTKDAAEALARSEEAASKKEAETAPAALTAESADVINVDEEDARRDIEDDEISGRNDIMEAEVDALADQEETLEAPPAEDASKEPQEGTTEETTIATAPDETTAATHDTTSDLDLGTHNEEVTDPQRTPSQRHLRANEEHTDDPTFQTLTEVTDEQTAETASNAPSGSDDGEFTIDASPSFRKPDALATVPSQGNSPDQQPPSPELTEQQVKEDKSARRIQRFFRFIILRKRREQLRLQRELEEDANATTDPTHPSAPSEGEESGSDGDFELATGAEQ